MRVSSSPAALAVGVIALVFSASTAAVTAHAGVAFPPWSDASDIPVPRWAVSVAPHANDTAVFRGPSRSEPRRGTLDAVARPPLYGALRGPGCNGRWLMIGPLAWTCSDDVELSGDEPPPFDGHRALAPRYPDDGLGFRYAFVGPQGARSFKDLAHAEDDMGEGDLDPGFAVTIVEEREAFDRRWAKTRQGKWILLSDLFAPHPVTLHGEAFLEGQAMDVAWVLPERSPTFADPKSGKATGLRTRFELVHRREEGKGPAAGMVRISDDGVSPAEWIHDRDLAHPTTAVPPTEVGGKDATERWIDVDLPTKTLVAYEGVRPVYAALVATGRGAPGTETATPRGVHRIWVKLVTSSMGNLGDEDAETRYSIEDVPYVQFFAKGVALHGAFWHHSFGAAHSHGCVNLAPVDARWLFNFTSPAVPTGWSAVLPVGNMDPGTVVRVR